MRQENQLEIYGSPSHEKIHLNKDNQSEYSKNIQKSLHVHSIHTLIETEQGRAEHTLTFNQIHKNVHPKIGYLIKLSLSNIHWDTNKYPGAKAVQVLLRGFGDDSFTLLKNHKSTILSDNQLVKVSHIVESDSKEKYEIFCQPKITDNNTLFSKIVKHNSAIGHLETDPEGKKSVAYNSPHGKKAQSLLEKKHKHMIIKKEKDQEYIVLDRDDYLECVGDVDTKVEFEDLSELKILLVGSHGVLDCDFSFCINLEFQAITQTTHLLSNDREIDYPLHTPSKMSQRHSSTQNKKIDFMNTSRNRHHFNSIYN